MKSRAMIGVGLLCLALTACQRAPAPAASETTPLAEAEATPPQPPKPPRKPPVPPAPAADAGSPAEIAPTAAAPPPEIAKVEPPPAKAEPPPPRIPLKLKPENLIGLDQPTTTQLLGQPSERSEAPPATIWRYTGRSCQLEIYFYLDLKSQVMRALHYEVKTHEAAEPARSQCFADLLAQHEADPVPGASPPN
jgi:hypothetical protein